MSDEIVISDREHETALVLANAGELAAALIKEISGNDIASSLDGSSLTKDAISNLVQRDILNMACTNPGTAV